MGCATPGNYGYSWKNIYLFILDKIRKQFLGVDNVGSFIENSKIIELMISRKSRHKIKDTKDIFCLRFLTDLKILSLSNFENTSLCDFESLSALFNKHNIILYLVFATII